MIISVLIPAYNEERYIETVINRVRAQRTVAEIIVVNDGSTDATRAILNGCAAQDARIHVVHLEKNSGKGAAIRQGLLSITGDVVIVQDADLEYSPEDYPVLIAPFNDSQVQVVYGSRMLNRNNKFSYLSFTAGGLLLSLITNILFLSTITDEPTGYKVFRTDVLRGMTLCSRGFEFCPEVTAKILRQGIKITEVPISYHPRTLAEGKKIRFRDGIIAMWTLLKYRLVK